MATPFYIANPPQSVSSVQGMPFTQLFEHFPRIEFLYTDFEKGFRASKYVTLAYNTWPILPLALVTAYALMITIVPRIMKDRKPFGLRNTLALWNLTLSLFSFCGMLRTVPHLLHNLATKSFRDTICTHPESMYGEGACGMWVMLFIFSKVPELVDTAFIVFRKSVSILLEPNPLWLD